MTDLSTSCAAQMEEIDSSKEEGSSMSAGTRLFKSSTVRFWSELGAGVGRVEVDSYSGDGDARCDKGVLNLTAGFAYGRGRLYDKVIGTKTRNERKGLTCLGSGV